MILDNYYLFLIKLRKTFTVFPRSTGDNNILWNQRYGYLSILLRGRPKLSPFSLTYRAYVTFYPPPPSSYVRNKWRNFILFCTLKKKSRLSRSPFKLRTVGVYFDPLPPLTYALYVTENGENYGRPLSGLDIKCGKMWGRWSCKFDLTIPV